jgi:hypothetical protein
MLLRKANLREIDALLLTRTRSVCLLSSPYIKPFAPSPFLHLPRNEGFRVRVGKTRHLSHIRVLALVTATTHRRVKKGPDL